MNKEVGQSHLLKLAEKCKKAGLKVTPQRMSIYKVLAGSTEHPSVNSVYTEVRKDMPNISFDTVNRTLKTLTRVGAAFTVEGSGDVKRFDGNLDEHQHFKCVKCKRIVDIFDGRFENIDVPSEIGEGFKILRKTVYFEGICDLCLNEDS